MSTPLGLPCSSSGEWAPAPGELYGRSTRGSDIFDGMPYTVADHPHMGRSIGRYDGEELVIDTADVEAGYLDTLGFPGLPQSAQMRTEERFSATGDHLRVVVTHYDSVYYTKPMVMTYEFVRVDTEIMPWGCTLEGANYDKRLEAAESASSTKSEGSGGSAR